MQIVQCSTCPICRSVMSNSKAYILRNRLAPDILDNIECHIRPHSLLTIKHAAQLLLAGCLDELGQRIEISDWHCDDSAMAIYGRLLWRIDLDSIVVYLLLCLLLFLNYSLFYYFIILFYFILFYFIYYLLFRRWIMTICDIFVLIFIWFFSMKLSRPYHRFLEIQAILFVGNSRATIFRPEDIWYQFMIACIRTWCVEWYKFVNYLNLS